MLQHPTPTHVRRAEVIATLSLGIDLGLNIPLQSMLRSCLLSVRLAEALGVGDDALVDAYYLALLRWVGCTADASTSAGVFGDELLASTWFAPIDRANGAGMMAAMIRNVGAGSGPLHRAGMVAHAFASAPSLAHAQTAHCEVAQRLADRLGMPGRIHEQLGQAFERWDGKGQPAGLKGEATALPVRVVQLAQDAGLHYALGGVEAAVKMARERSGDAHDPELVDWFCRNATEFLAEADVESAWDAVLDIEPGPRPVMSGPEFDTALRAMADFTDLKSPYTGNHSSGVAELALAAAAGCRLPENEANAVRQAGLVHDIGRVGITAAIWNKPGRLTDDEWERVRLHPYYTERVLTRSPAFAHLAQPAALHHERLDGSGYHKSLPGAMLPTGARILAAADAYHAMIEPRPHREPLSADQAAEALHQEVRAGRLDGDATNAVLAASGHRVSPRRREFPAGLSEREIEVLRLVARGMSNKQMAQELVISRATVDHHIRHIYDKIGVSTRAAATLFALQHDLLD